MPETESIAGQITELKQSMAGHAPAEILAVMARQQERLEADGAPAGLVRVGSALPDGEVLTAAGEPSTLAAVRGSRPAVLVFYRGAWCPYCNITLRTYQQRLAPELAARGAELIAISPQTPDGSLTMRQKHELSYQVISDPGNAIAGKLGLLGPISDEVVAVQAAMGLDFATLNADGTPMLPMPTVIIADAAGVIRWIDVHPNYTTRTEPEQILAALASLFPPHAR